MLKKIQEDEATGVVIVPDWNAQPWFPVFQKMLIGESLFFKPSNLFLLSPCKTLEHPLCNQLTLIAEIVCGRPIKGKS